MAFFTRKIGNRASLTGVSRLVESLRSQMNASQLTSGAIANVAISTENLREEQVDLFVNANDNLRVTIENISTELGLSELSIAQMDSAVAAGMIVGDAPAFFGRSVAFANVSTENMHVVDIPVADGLSQRSLAVEAYDERENRNAAVYSIAYNMQAARQDEFGETFFPTIVVTPDNVGFAVTVRLMQVMNDVVRSTTGVVDNYGKKNIIRALADPTILKNEMTRIVPVYRASAADKFVATADVASRVISLDGESITTSPLVFGKKLSLLGISQPDTLLANGQSDVTDAIEPAVTLQTVYIKVGADVLRFNTGNIPLSNFTYSTQNNARVMTLNFDTTSLLLNKATKNVDGSALVDLASVVTGDFIVRLAMNVSGTVNVETSETVVYGNAVSIAHIFNAAGEELALTDASVADIVTAFAGAKMLGYEPLAFRTDSNRRQRGQLIDTTYYTQLYNVPLRSPVTAIHPVTVDGQNDSADLSALITTTRIRTSNASVTALIAAANTLSEYIDVRDSTGLGPDLLGVGRHFVRPSYFHEEIDMNDIVDSLKSHERSADIQAALVNKVRDYAYNMYRDSEYKAAADALAGGLSKTPVVIIGTDPVLARYLNVTGDLRTLGGEFDVRVVSSLDNRVAGKIFISFGVFDENRNVVPNPLNFGNMAWSPELSVVLPISRNGQISKELSVQPRFLHVTNLPVLTVLEVSNVRDVLNKVSVFTQTP